MKCGIRVCLIHVGSQRDMVMSQIYTEYMKMRKINYDIILLARNGEMVPKSANIYCFHGNMSGIINKIITYIKYRKYVKKILNTNKYDFLIVWSEITAAIFSDILIDGFPGKYCINVRDLLVGFKGGLFKDRLFCAISKSAFTTVASERYLSYFKQNEKIFFFHSYNAKLMKNVMIHKQNRIDMAINILFIGAVRFYNHFYRFIREISNDIRYRFIIAGYNEVPVRQYVKNNNIHNVEIYGAFEVDKTTDFLAQADVLYNLYGTEDENLRSALSNKLYYALYMNIPILAYKDTYTYEVAQKAGIGFAVDDSYKKHMFADDFYDWYHNRDVETSKIKCDEWINQAIKSQDALLQRFEMELRKCGVLT